MNGCRAFLCAKLKPPNNGFKSKNPSPLKGCRAFLCANSIFRAAKIQKFSILIKLFYFFAQSVVDCKNSCIFAARKRDKTNTMETKSNNCTASKFCTDKGGLFPFSGERAAVCFQRSPFFWQPYY